MNNFTIRRAGTGDYQVILNILEASGLPTAGVPESPDNFLVADGGGNIAGVIGLEKEGWNVLLRSLAVSQSLRNRGIGAALMDRALEVAREEGCREAFLLTATAEKYLADWGFARIDRSGIPAVLLEASALNTACPSCSTCMKLDLG